ncbi:MaoC family dehydratase [Streptosporangiaceae bacterium NEAU-GS5]|nr:MaoC family dehydratase [Streptosporangiaceae bacterium NEAU-GS5]
MAATVKYDEVEVGQQIPPVEYPVRRVNLVMYAGASGDFNPIHWNERFARAVGLPDVIAHGMFTMAQGGRYVTDWAGDPTAVIDYGVRFSSMVVVPDDEEGATITVSGIVEDKLDGKRVVIALNARSGDARVLSKARAVVQLV